MARFRMFLNEQLNIVGDLLQIVSKYGESFSQLTHFFLTHVDEHTCCNVILFRKSSVDTFAWVVCKYSTARSHTTQDWGGFTFHTGGSGSGGASDLPRETGTLDGLRALFNFILIAAAVNGHDLTCPLLYLVWDWGERERERNETGGSHSNSLTFMIAHLCFDSFLLKKESFNSVCRNWQSHINQRSISKD